MNQSTEMENQAAPTTVCCIILTFNRLTALKNCLNLIQTQTRRPDLVHVVNNGSKADTAKFLEEEAGKDPIIHVSTLPENLGPAGGYAYGMNWALEKSFSHMWVMDDDVFPELDCLQNLLQEIGNKTNQFLYPRVLDKDQRPANFPAWVGVLIPSSAVKIAGVPNKDLFWWTEDTEYLQWRLPKIYGIHSAISPQAKVIHGVDDGKQKPAWKYYYEVRNTIYYRFFVQKGNLLRRVRRTMLAVGKPILRTILFEQEKTKKLKMIFIGLQDGALQRLGKRIDPERSRLR